MTSPLTLSVDTPESLERWRPLVQWVLAIPQFVVTGALSYAAGALGFISFFAILFTRQIPDGVYRAQVMILRYNLRVTTYGMFLHAGYPPFEFNPVAEDPGGSPAVLSFVDPPEQMSRFLPLIKWLLIIPHVVVLFVLLIGAFFAWIGAFFAVLFTGKYPEGIQRYMVGVLRWSFRINAYGYLLTDEYPPFSLD